MKQMEVIEKKIGENMFYLRAFPAFTAANISGELAAMITPMLSGIAPLVEDATKPVGEGEKDFDIMDVDIEKALPAVSNAFSSLSGDKFEKMMKKLLIEHKNIPVEGEVTDGETKILTYDLANEVFCGELQDMYALCFEVIRINFGGFFKKIGARFGDLQTVLRGTTPKSGNTDSSTQPDFPISN